MSLPPKRYLAILVVALLAVLGGLVGPRVYAQHGNGSAKDRIEASPPPVLFTDHQTAEVDPLVTPQDQRAHRLMQRWWADHGSGRHDAAFVGWVEDSFPSPPGTAARTRELARVDALARTRNADGVRAATWLEQFGKKDIWKLYAHDQAEWVSGATGDERKSEEKDLLAMTKTIADDLGAEFQQSAPYVLEPSLRPDHTVKDGQVCPCSYPSRHAGAAAASRVFLGHFDAAPRHRLPVDGGRDRLLPHLHGRARAQRHQRRLAARRHGRGVLPGHPRRSRPRARRLKFRREPAGSHRNDRFVVRERPVGSPRPLRSFLWSLD